MYTVLVGYLKGKEIYFDDTCYFFKTKNNKNIVIENPYELKEFERV